MYKPAFAVSVQLHDTEIPDALSGNNVLVLRSGDHREANHKNLQGHDLKYSVTRAKGSEYTP